MKKPAEYWQDCEQCGIEDPRRAFFSGIVALFVMLENIADLPVESRDQALAEVRQDVALALMDMDAER